MAEIRSVKVGTDYDASASNIVLVVLTVLVGTVLVFPWIGFIIHKYWLWCAHIQGKF
jgi:hypothetical protein